MKQIKLIVSILIILFTTAQAKNKKTGILTDTIYSNVNGNGIELHIELVAGEAHNHPTFAFWAEDTAGNFTQTLFVTKSLATGVYGHGPINDSIWGKMPGEAYRPAALPYWNHKRTEQPVTEKIMPNPNNKIPDAYSGATPSGSFLLKTKTDKPIPGKYRLVLEINQTWDWNEYWTNNKYPDDKYYKTSSQPSVVYSVTIDTESSKKEYNLNAIGHGHYAGSDGKLYTDLSKLTTALEIVKSVKVVLKGK